VLYRNAVDCIRKVYANEGGIRGFYRGVTPQLVGVAPEKAIKLTVNELVRKKATDPETGRIPLHMEFVAGGTAGGCQVVSSLNVLDVAEVLRIVLRHRL
jgi:solute carrier family 25 aspartate/glutamate transporter 12/13